MANPRPITPRPRATRGAGRDDTPDGADAPTGIAGARVGAGPAVTWVSADSIRARLAAWGMGQGRSARDIVSDVGLRTAIGVAAAVLELERDAAWAHWGDDAGRGAAGARGVREDVAELARRSGFALAAVERALAALTAAGVIARTTAAGGTMVRLQEDALVVAPCCAQIAWAGVRDMLVAQDVALPAPMAVLRALATRTEGGAGEADVWSVRASVRDLADDTHFGRSAVADAVSALHEARMLALESRAGRVTRYTLTPCAFGHTPIADDDARAARDARVVAARPARPTDAMRSPAQARDTPARPGGAPTSPVLLGVFGDTPIHAPIGTPLTLEQDERGRWYCRIGPHLRLGPLEP